ncbi:uncharacterized protein KQ657_002268 [Scheffersomyces spartinae]|uniref:Uncharacterized protein n=1 Tax=Scheffersomyces spartinae TaxID=45513 RepID=A0A9P7VD30_9ASCO|nr:uncharacterized protein KQ657_002268 [Scheffersomyces spartinae]KAG7195883.1 hypothetical protein KQ657_002268 [Scheffersomyces spartinae]
MKLLKGVNNIVSLAIRLSQLVFGIIVFALGVFVADKFDSGRAGFNAAVARNKAPTKSWTALSTLCMGGIYPQNTLVRHADAENNTGVTNENDPVAGEHKYTTDNLTTGEHKYDGHGLSLGEAHYDSNVHNGGEAMYDSNAHHISEPRFDSNAQTMAAPGEQPIGYGAK